MDGCRASRRRLGDERVVGSAAVSLVAPSMRVWAGLLDQPWLARLRSGPPSFGVPGRLGAAPRRPIIPRHIYCWVGISREACLTRFGCVGRHRFRDSVGSSCFVWSLRSWPKAPVVPRPAGAGWRSCVRVPDCEGSAPLVRAALGIFIWSLLFQAGSRVS